MTEFEEYFMTMVRMSGFNILDLVLLMHNYLQHAEDITDEEYMNRIEVVENFLAVFYDA